MSPWTVDACTYNSVQQSHKQIHFDKSATRPQQVLQQIRNMDINYVYAWFYLVKLCCS